VLLAQREAFSRVQASGRYVLGAEVAAFEAEFATACGVAHAIGVASGSDALELALRAAGVTAGDEVATVANAAMYTTLAIRAIGARPRFVDVDDTTLLVDPVALVTALTHRTRAVVVTHLYGRLAPMRDLAEVTRRWGIPIIEDCAQAHGASRDGQCAGSYGLAGCFSFYPTKNLGALGDGGAVVTADPAFADRLRALRQYGWRRKYEVVADGGRNSRLDEMQAAMLRVRLPGLHAANAQRRAIAGTYATRIRHPALRMPPAPGSDDVAHLFVLRTPDRCGLAAALATQGIDTHVHYPVPDHRQPIVAADYASIRLPVSERACSEVLSLPCFPELTVAEIDSVIASCNAWSR
jgi:dTDP-4-amino-4,6-dideoxygalactose transaminase